MTNPDSQQDHVTEARKLLGQPSALVIGDRTITVRSYGWSQLFQVLAAAQPIIDAMAAAPELAFAEVLQAQRGHVNTLMALSTGLSIEEIEGLPLSGGLKLAYAVWAENEDFFAQELMPMLASALASKTAKLSSNAAPTSSQAADVQEPQPDGQPLPIA